MIYGYDPAGRLTKTTTASGIATTFGYDRRGNQTSIVDALANTTRTAYDPAGRPATTTDARGYPTTNTYDAAGQLTQRTDTLGGSVRFAYNPAGERVSVTDPGGNTRTTIIDVAAASTTVTAADALGRQQTTMQDAAGRTTTKTDARGLTTSYLYELDGQPRTETPQEPAGGPDTVIGYTYDTAGRRETMTGPTGTTRWAYNSDGKTASVTQNDGTADAKTVAYTYDTASRRRSMTVPPVGTAPGGTVSYGYDTAGRLASISNPSTGPPAQSTTISYLADGRTDTIARPNGVITTNTYDPAGRLDGITHRNGTGAELQKFAYTLDENGNRVAQRWSTNSGPQTTETYSLDELSRLTGVNYGDSTSETFAYNPDGTRKTRTAIGGPTPGVTNYQYDNAQQLTSVDGTAVPGGSQTFTYDNNGNLTSSSRSPLAAQPATPPRPVDPPTRISEEPTSASRSRRCRVQSLRRSLS